MAESWKDTAWVIYNTGSVETIPCHLFRSHDLISEDVRQRDRARGLLGILHHNNSPPMTIACTNQRMLFYQALKKRVVLIALISVAQAVILLPQSPE